MVSLFNSLGTIFWMLSIAACAASKSAIHETVALLELTIGAIFFVGAALIDELRKLNRPVQNPPPSAPADSQNKRAKII